MTSASKTVHRYPNITSFLFVLHISFASQVHSTSVRCICTYTEKSLSIYDIYVYIYLYVCIFINLLERASYQKKKKTLDVLAEDENYCIFISIENRAADLIIFRVFKSTILYSGSGRNVIYALLSLNTVPVDFDRDKIVNTLVLFLLLLLMFYC